MKHGSLFSGIGGFDLAAQWMGWENVFHCEQNHLNQRKMKEGKMIIEKQKGGISAKEYDKIHAWIKYHYGKAVKCTLCKDEDKRKFEWALKKGQKYQKDINSFMQLCISCHRKYDYTEEQGKKVGAFHRGKKLSEEEKIVIGNFHRGKVLSVETRKKISNSWKNKTLLLNTKTGETYCSIKQASSKLKIGRRTLSALFKKAVLDNQNEITYYPRFSTERTLHLLINQSLQTTSYILKSNNKLKQ